MKIVLAYAFSSKNNEILKMLIRNGGYVDVIDKDLNTPLHLAVLNNCCRDSFTK